LSRYFCRPDPFRCDGNLHEGTKMTPGRKGDLIT
jgi:hypothetical protein